MIKINLVDPQISKNKPADGSPLEGLSLKLLSANNSLLKLWLPIKSYKKLHDFHIPLLAR